jgi:DNA-binding CsgD family transcriptional regulator
MGDVGRILQAVDRIYGAVTSAAWSSAVEAVTETVRGDHAFLHVGRVDDGAAHLLATARVDDGELVRLMSPEAARIAQPFERGIPCGIFDRRDLVPDAEFARSAYYNELVRPLGGFHSIAANNSSADGYLLTVCRSRPGGEFEAAEIAQFTWLAPHIATAVALRRRMRTAEHVATSLAGLLDRIHTGVVLTDACSLPGFINGRAWDLLVEADGLALHAGRLAAASPAVTRGLRAAIAAAAGAMRGDNRKLHHAASLAAEPAHRLRLARPSQRPPLLVTVLPVGRLGMAVPGVRVPQVAVFVTEPDAPPRIDRDALADAFHLTRRESETVALLAAGLDPGQIAAALDVTVSSVRQYFKRAFDKTGTHSQAALVALARGFVEPLREDLP